MALESEFLRACLGRCLIAAADLENLAQRLDNPDGKKHLRAARRSLKRCIRHIEFAFKLV